MPNLDLEVLKYDHNLKGNVEINNKLCPLDNVIQGEIVNLDLSKEGKITKYFVKLKSDKRIKVDCNIYDKCGGCSLRHIDYNEQLRIKKQYVEELFYNAFNKHYQVNNTLGMKEPFNYRNKCQVAIKNEKGKLVCGFYEENSHHTIESLNCLIQDTISNKIIETIKELMIKMHYKAYDEDHHTGLFRHVLIKRSFKTNQIMVVIVTGSPVFPGSNNFVKALISHHKEITTIIHNINPRNTSVILGDDEKVLYGSGYILDILMGYKFKVSSKSFYQINPIQCEVLYEAAIKLADLKKTDYLLDAYCGVGTIGIIASKHVNKVIGVEINKDAVRDAIVNAKTNNINNIHFFNADAVEFIKNLAKRGDKLDVIIMDPPRSGSDIKFINAVIKMMPRVVVYISCNPETQVRDIKDLLPYYQIKCIQPVDMFPYTSHVETIVCLVRK